MHTGTPGKLKASLHIDVFALGLVLDVLLRDVCSASTTALPTDDDERVAVLTSASEEGMRRCLQSHILYRPVVEKLCSLRPDQRGSTSDPDINRMVSSGAATGLHASRVELETAKKHNAFLQDRVSTSLDDLKQGQEGLSQKLDEVMSIIRAGFASVHQDVEGVGRCVTHQLVKQRQLGQESNDAIHNALEALIVASQRTSDSLGTLSNDSKQAVQLLENLQGSVASFRDEASGASAETREHAEALVRHLSEVTDELRSCSGRGGDNSQLLESAMQEMTVQMATMTSELTAIRENVSRILTEVANLGTQMARVVEGNAALQNKLFDLSDGLSQMHADDAKQYSELQNNITGFQVAMNAMAANPSAAPMLEMLSAQVRETQNAVNTLLVGAHTIPTLALLLPKPKTKLQQKIDPRNLFTDKYILVFLCGQTYQKSPKEYLVTMVKKWVVEAMPVFKLGLMLLKVALAVGGIPIPGLSDILGTDFTQHVKYVDLAMKHLDKSFGSAVDKMKDGIVDTLGDGLDAAKDREDLEAILNRIHSNPEGSRQAYDAIIQLLAGVDIPSTCCLRQVICNGKVGWVLDREDVVAAFRERCLR